VHSAHALLDGPQDKTLDLRYHSVRHELKKGTFAIKWFKGSSNLAECSKKIMLAPRKISEVAGSLEAFDCKVPFFQKEPHG
jgi:hypothetical protein